MTQKHSSIFTASLLLFSSFLSSCDSAETPELTVKTSAAPDKAETSKEATVTPAKEPLVEAGISNICATDPNSFAISGTLPPAPIQVAGAGYNAEWFIKPSLLNMPHAVMLAPDGDLLVQSNGSNQLFKISLAGEVSLLAENVSGYYGDIDEEGNVYLYDFVPGAIIRVAPDGSVQTIVEAKEISTACDSGFTIGWSGNFYIALNPCGDESSLFQIDRQGKITLLKEHIPNMPALRMTPQGKLLGVSPEGQVYSISAGDFQVKLMQGVSLTLDWPEYISAGGLAADEDGNLYVASCGRCNAGRIYQVNPDGESTVWAVVPGNGLSGIEWLSKTNEIVGGQLRTGGLLGMSAGGALREIIPGNGIVTPTAIQFSPCGELVVANDEGGNLSLVYPSGEHAWLADLISFGPPNPFMTFDQDGTLYVSEAAPGFPDRVKQMPVGESLRVYAGASKPAGLIMSAGGSLLVAEANAGRITQIGQDGSRSIHYEGLDFPTAMERDSDGNLYVVTASPDLLWDEFWAVPVFGDGIIRIAPDGNITPIFKEQGVHSLAIGQDGYLYATVFNRVIRISPDGRASDFASGFVDCHDLAFDLAGNLYICDRALNGIVRISGFPQGLLRGVALDSSRQPVENARVHVYTQAPTLTGNVVYTDASGQFTLPATPGTHTISVSKEGYSFYKEEGITIQPGGEYALEMILAD